MKKHEKKKSLCNEASAYPDERAFESNPITKIMGKPLLYPMNHASNFLGSSMVTGKIKSVSHFTFHNIKKEEIPIHCIDVETQYGTLSIVHPASLVQDGEHV